MNLKEKKNSQKVKFNLGRGDRSNSTSFLCWGLRRWALMLLRLFNPPQGAPECEVTQSCPTLCEYTLSSILAWRQGTPSSQIIAPVSHHDWGWPGDERVLIIVTIITKTETSLAVQCLRLQASIAGDTGSIPGRGTKIPHVVQHHPRINR